tara:strand:+ start:360 stop:590 length:231 start_codon:yes stop_codon:yes gene_type:complete
MLEPADWLYVKHAARRAWASERQRNIVMLVLVWLRYGLLSFTAKPISAVPGKTTVPWRIERVVFSRHSVTRLETEQ